MNGLFQNRELLQGDRADRIYPGTSVAGYMSLRDTAQLRNGRRVSVMSIDDIRRFLHYGACVFAFAITMHRLVCPAFAEDQPPAGWDLVYDFMVQDVCTDVSGKVLPGISPVEGSAKCPYHRNLRVGERLPYHKHDWANLAVRASLPGGYQREDSFPIRTRALGIAVAQIFDFGNNERVFGQFDHGDGGQIVVFSPRSVAFGLTEDGGGGLQFFFGPQCNARERALRISDSWIVVDRSFSLNQPGHSTTRLSQNPSACPDRLNYSFTRWQVKPVHFRYKSGEKESPVDLETLISEHFGGRDVATAGHLERFYFTRELGWTRWERWQNLLQREKPDDRAHASNLANSGRCDQIEGVPASSGEWLMIDCRQWTNMVPAIELQGDPPGFWTNVLRNRTETRELFSE